MTEEQWKQLDADFVKQLIGSRMRCELCSKVVLADDYQWHMETHHSDDPEKWPVIRLEPGGDLVTALPEEVQCEARIETAVAQLKRQFREQLAAEREKYNAAYLKRAKQLAAAVEALKDISTGYRMQRAKLIADAALARIEEGK
jgi:hypothetical protein